jgi:hypothetical protein
VSAEPATTGWFWHPPWLQLVSSVTAHLLGIERGGDGLCWWTRQLLRVVCGHLRCQARTDFMLVL